MIATTTAHRAPTPARGQLDLVPPLAGQFLGHRLGGLGPGH
jgi:hypothetical protein